jgi:alcohol dehydrogenase
MSLNTTVAPFILRGVSLLGIDSGTTPAPLRREVWRRLAGDMRPAHLKDMTRTITIDALPQAFEGLLKGAAKGRIVVDLAA